MSNNPEPPVGAQAAPSQLKVDQEDYLRRRAVDPAEAARIGWRSVTAEEARDPLELADVPSSGGLLIPYLGTDPIYYRLRLDAADGGARFLCPPGRDVPLYIPFEQIGDEDVLVVVEGPVKALAMYLTGVKAIGLGGTGTTLDCAKDGARRLNSSWARVMRPGRKVIVLFDSNRTTNPCVARDEARLVMALEAAGAEVSVARLAHDASGKDWGPDDALAVLGPEAVKNLLNEAVPADPVVRLRDIVEGVPVETRLANAARLLDDMPFLLSVQSRSAAVPVIKDLFKRVGVGAKEVNDALRRAGRRLEDAQLAGEPTMRSTDYDVVDGRIGKWVGRADNKDFHALCNFDCRIVCEVTLDDGVARERRLVLSGTVAPDVAGDPVVLPEITIDPMELEVQAWPLRKWDARAIVSGRRGATSELREAIQSLSTPAQIRTFAHTGWRKIDGQEVFLHADGAVGADDVAVELDGPLARYRLPPVAMDPEDALRSSLRVLDIADWKITVPLLAAVYRAPLQSLLACDATVAFIGPTGEKKSTLAALALGHFGDLDRTHMPGTWADTNASLEHRMFAAADVPFVIDDFAPNGNEARDEHRRKAEVLLRAIGNKSSRGRMRSDLTARPDRPPRCLVMMTGEDLPTGSSILARMVPVQVTKGCVNLEVLTEVQNDIDHLPHAMTAYLTWLAPQLENLRGHLKARLDELRPHFIQQGQHARAPEALAHLAIGFEQLLLFAIDLKVLSDDEATDMLDEAVDALRSLGSSHVEDMVSTDPVEVFVSELKSLLAQGKVKLAPRASALEQSGTVEMIGWYTSTEILLLPDAAFRVVVKSLREAGKAMPVTQRTLWGRMKERALLVATDADHCTVKRSVADQERRVLVLEHATLEFAPTDAPSRFADVLPFRVTRYTED